ncbi:MAG: (Fe-S)-binding protein, partial [Moorella sp. (in: Bacteria)]|nr:(Fe-S)-binding protein [Moorella sp. (in: firmicutes)]
ALKKDFPELLAGDGEWQERARDLAAKVKDFTELFRELTAGQWQAAGQPGQPVRPPVKVTYHDSCHFKRHLGLDQVARQVLAARPGLELVEMQESDRCCGFGGSYSIKYPEISVPILERKLKNIIASDATVVATDCPGCILQLRGGLDQAGSPVSVRHTAEILAGGEDFSASREKY